MQVVDHLAANRIDLFLVQHGHHYSENVLDDVSHYGEKQGMKEKKEEARARKNLSQGGRKVSPDSPNGTDRSRVVVELVGGYVEAVYATGAEISCVLVDWDDLNVDEGPPEIVVKPLSQASADLLEVVRSREAGRPQT